MEEKYTTDDINLESLSEIKVEDDLRDFLPAFLVRRFYDLDNLKALLIEKKFEEIDQLAHKLKGNGSAYGFNEITSIAIEIREAISAKNNKDVTDLIQRLEKYLLRFKSS